MAASLVVIGSGPTAIACAHALASSGYDVTMIDAGVELEPERARVVERLQSQAPQAWAREDLAILKDGAGATGSGVPIKRLYGSDFPYREARDHGPLTTRDVTAFTSFARGGLSNVWGAAVAPYRPEEIRDWPISIEDLAAYYKRVFQFVPLAAERDDLEGMFPFYSDNLEPLTSSKQAEMLLERMERKRKRLEQQGFVWGRSRLAVRQTSRAGRHGCVYCGLCMYGCPYDLIYNSAQTLDELVASGRVSYHKDMVVGSLAERDGGILIHGHDRRTRAPFRIEADRVFLGAGVYSTARIMLRSMGQDDDSLTMRDSQYFLLPLLALPLVRPSDTERLHTLAQLFVELRDPALGSYPVHLQLYTYNDLYASAVKSTAGMLYPLVRVPAGALLRRLMVIQGYLHSDLSGSATMRLRPDGTLEVTRQINPQSNGVVRHAVKKLRRNARALGFLPIRQLLKIGAPGQGAHVGGTLPMRRDPSKWETDVMGRPQGFSRLHIVDASVLPSIPSTTITLSAMANAYRIGTEWRDYVG